MSVVHGGGHSIKDWTAALAEAEKCLVRPGAEDEEEVCLSLDEIETRPVLFQPREFLGKGDTDKRHVGRLQRTMNHVGEMDPVVVIKLRTPLENSYDPKEGTTAWKRTGRASTKARSSVRGFEEARWRRRTRACVRAQFSSSKRL
jgi:hypothetical protein